MENDDYALLSKDDYLNALNQQDDQFGKDNSQAQATSNFQMENNQFDYLTNSDDHSNENHRSNDAENNSADQQINETQVLREQDLYLPLTNISRIMKQNLPKEGKIAKEAKIMVQECISEFISFITSEASDRCLAEKRKTLNGEDILFAMEQLGFDNYIEPLRIFLHKYKQLNSTTAHITGGETDILSNNN